MPVRTRAVRGAAGAALVVGLAAPSVPAQAAAGPAGVLTVRGSSTVETTTRLGAPSRVSVDGVRTSAQVAVSGGGRLAGVVLEQLDVADPVVLIAASASACDASGCARDERFEYVSTLQPEPSDTGDEVVTLPAGRYRVVLVADGAPVTVTLQLSGLGRSRTLRPAAASTASLRDVVDQLPALGPAAVGFSGGVQHDGDRPQVVLYRELYRTAPGAAGAFGTCVIEGSEPPAGVYGPRCPTAETAGDRVESVSPVVVAEPAEVALVGYGHTTLPAGRHAVGHYLLSAVPVSSAEVVQLVVPLSTDGGPAVSPSVRAGGPVDSSHGAPADEAPLRAATPAAAVLPSTGGRQWAAAVGGVTLVTALALSAGRRPAA